MYPRPERSSNVQLFHEHCHALQKKKTLRTNRNIRPALEENVLVLVNTQTGQGVKLLCLTNGLKADIGSIIKAIPLYLGS